MPHPRNSLRYKPQLSGSLLPDNGICLAFQVGVKIAVTAAPVQIPPAVLVSTGSDTAALITVPPTGVDVQVLERALIVYALDVAGGNRTRAARLLRLTRSALLYRMKKHGLAIKCILAVLAGILTAAPAAAQQVSLAPPVSLAFNAAPAAAGLPPVSSDEAATLAALVAELERNNPELAAARRDIDMRVARIAPAGAPPDPTLSFGYMGGFFRPFFPSASTPNAFQQFGATQEIPYPGKLALRSRIAATEAEAERWNYEGRRRWLVAELKSACIEYVFVDRSLAIVQRNKELLDQFRQIAEAQFSVGKGLQQDVLKAQVEISLLIERLTVLERRRGTLQAAINGLLYRRPDTPVSADLTFQTATFTQNVNELRTLVQTRYPALKRDEQVINRGQQSLALAKKEVLPDFAVNFTSQRFSGEMPWMYGVDFMVKLPIFWQRKQRPMIAEAAAALESGRQMRENTLAMAAAGVTEQYLAATTSRRLMDLYGDSILPQARLTLESSIAAYQVGSVDFLTLLTNFMTVLTYEVNYEEQTAQYRRALAQLEPLVGVEFIR